MNSEESSDLRTPEDACPKRLWVMLTLSDDEALGAGGELPRGLTFHLSRCDSCRELADRLISVSDSLQSLSTLEPPGNLQLRADSQALQALSDGARLTGRVAIPDLPETFQENGHKRSARRWIGLRRYVAAAVILITVGVVGLFEMGDRSQESLVEEASPSRRAFAPEPPGTDAQERQFLSSGKPSERNAAGDTSPSAGRAEQASGREKLLAVNLSRGRSNSDRPGNNRRPRCICRHRSHVEAAMCENTNCVHQAVILPSPGQRDLGWGQTLLDISRFSVSTEESGDDR